MVNVKQYPKYQIIENDIIEKINSGHYSHNDALPTEATLSKQYNCSRVTVRQALSNLAFKGYIRKEQGSGSYVNKVRTIQRTTRLLSFTEEMKENGKQASSVVRTFSVTTAGSTIANILNISPSDTIYYIERTRYADDDPVLFEKTFMSTDLHPELSLKVLQSSKYEYGDSQGLYVTHATQTVLPIFPKDYIAQELKIEQNQPILKVCNITYLEDGRVFDYTELNFHPELYQLNIYKKRDVEES